jgi:phosphoglycolate phosphatase
VAEALTHSSRLQTGEIGTIIIDLDGTLVDSAPDLADALDELLQERGLETIGVDGARKLIGHGIVNLVKKALQLGEQPVTPIALETATTRFRELYAKRLPAKAVAYPGVFDALKSLKADNWRLVVCTNKLESFSRKILEGLGLAAFFDVIAGPDTYGVAKPDPQHLLRTLPKSMPPGYKAIMIGDSEVDVETAHAANIPVIAVTYGYSKMPLAQLNPQALATSFSEVPKLVKKLANETRAKICAP